MWSIMMPSEIKTLCVGLNHIAFVDAEDYPRLSRYRWFLGSMKDGTVWAYRYDMRGPAINKSGHRLKIQLSHDVLGLEKGMRVRHKNRNRLDCTKSNLEVREGCIHRRDGRHIRKPFRALVCIDYRNYDCGNWPRRSDALFALELAKPVVQEMRGKGHKPGEIKRALREAVGL